MGVYRFVLFRIVNMKPIFKALFGPSKDVMLPQL
jgi:hypothetical protein